MLFAELPSSEKEVMHGIVLGKAIPNMTQLTADLISIIAFLCQKLNLIEDEEEPSELSDDQAIDHNPDEKEKEPSTTPLVDTVQANCVDLRKNNTDLKPPSNDWKFPALQFLYSQDLH